VPAAGWIKELKADDSGLWGRVEWTATAREMIGRKEYRYLSPSFLFHPKTRQILRLKGAGLVHNPNLHLTALASQETDMPPETANPKTPAADTSFAEFGAELASLLGLPAGASPKELMARLAARLMKTPEEPDPSKYMSSPCPQTARLLVFPCRAPRHKWPLMSKPLAPILPCP
jgi:phage I-like protein